jgi:hypothetical protein
MKRNASAVRGTTPEARQRGDRLRDGPHRVEIVEQFH